MERTYGISERTFSYDHGNFGINNLIPTALLHVSMEGIGTTQSDSNGILLQNSFPAVSGAQQYSPPIVLAGQGSASTSGTSRDVRWRIEVAPTGSSTNPSSTIQFSSSINGGAYTTVFGATSAAIFSVSGNLNTTQNIAAGNQLLATNSSTTTSQTYRTTNGGSNVTPLLFTGSAVNTAGNLSFAFDTTNSFSLLADNGTRHIARAAIQLTNLDNTAGSEDGDLIFLTQSAGGAMSEKLRITNTGNVFGTALHNNATSPTGATNQYIASGTYTPTLTGVANVAASTAYLAQWMRVGNVLHVSGKLDVDPTLAATSTQLGISLPIASAIANAYGIGGVAFCPTIASMGAAILGDATNGRAQLEFISTDLNNDAMYFVFQYLII